ncbi:MAG: saccharopine dehydrogenase C-terminal domain-containing protein, partial [Candidatus Bathyarchaeia archaeon]
KNLYKPDVKDIVVLKVDVHGYRKNGMVRLTYTLTDFYDEKSGVTAMARTTGYTASIVAKLIVEGVVRLKGVVPPERLGMDRTIYQQIMAELNSRGIKIVEETFAE